MKKVKVNFQTNYFSEHCYKSAQPTFSQKDLQFVIRVFSIIWTKTQVGKKDILFDKMFLKRLKYTLLKLDKLCSLFFFFCNNHCYVNRIQKKLAFGGKNWPSYALSAWNCPFFESLFLRVWTLSRRFLEKYSF